MVDLSPAVPGVQQGDPWRAVSRWGMAWRVTLGCLFIGMVGSLLLAVLDGFSEGPSLLGGGIGIIFGVAPAVLFGGIAALIGPWLQRRSSAVMQALVFALIGVTALAVLFFGIDVATTAGDVCPPNHYCWNPGDQAMMVLLVSGFPLTIMAGAGYGLAIWAEDRKEKRRTQWIALAAVAAVFAATNLFAFLARQ